MTETHFEECIKRICRGDKSGLKDIYEEYLPYLYKIIYGIVGNKENAEDITGDFFVKLWSLAPEYKPGNGHKGYLASIARNMAIDQVRRSRREVLMADPEQTTCGNNDDGKTGMKSPAEGNPGVKSGKAADAGTGTEYAPEEQVISDMSLKEALSRLKPEERQIINMKVLSEMTFKEIAKILDIPMGTVTWRYQEGIKRLRRCGYE